MTATSDALRRLEHLLQDQRAALLAGAGDLTDLAQRLQRALAEVAPALALGGDSRLQASLQRVRSLAADNSLLLQAALQGRRDAQTALSAVKGVQHGTYAADGSIQHHAAPAGRLHRKT